MQQVLESADLLERALGALDGLLPDGSGPACRLKELPDGGAGDGIIIVPSDLGKLRLLVQAKDQVYPAVVKRLQERLVEAARTRELHPAVTAPYLSPATLAACREAEISAWDLCGNAAVRLPGIIIRVEGKPNVFGSREPDRNIFAPKASRLLRVLLMHLSESWRVSSLAEETKLSKGYVSRLVAELVMGQVAYRDEAGVIRLLDPRLLLEEWARNYKPARGGARRYFMPFDGPTEALERLARLPDPAIGEWAATGPAGADIVDPYLRVGTVHLFRSGKGELTEHLPDLKPTVRGANVLVYRPYDEFVYYGARRVRGIPVVSDLQLYLDLSRSGGRAAEQAARFLAKVAGEDADGTAVSRP